MDGATLALAVALMLAGLIGTYYWFSGRSIKANPISRLLFCVRGREQSKAFVAFSSAALPALGVYLILSTLRPSIPLWPLIGALAAFGGLQIAAHLQRDDV